MCPKVVDAKILELGSSQYNIIRSFYESSLKDCYQWNVGIKLPMTHTVMFRKAGKWVLSINHYSALLCSDAVHGIGFPVGIWVIVNYTHHRGRITINTNKTEYVDVEDPDITYVTAGVPYAYPISIRDLIDKLKIYIDVVEKAVPRNELECNRYCFTRADC
jgi:hypothetical protein